MELTLSTVNEYNVTCQHVLLSGKQKGKLCQNRRIYNKLFCKIHDSKYNDPLTLVMFIPADLLTLISSHLCFIYQLMFRYVCKTWRLYACSIKPAYQQFLMINPAVFPFEIDVYKELLIDKVIFPPKVVTQIYYVFSYWNSEPNLLSLIDFSLYTNIANEIIYIFHKYDLTMNDIQAVHILMPYLTPELLARTERFLSYNKIEKQ